MGGAHGRDKRRLRGGGRLRHGYKGLQRGEKDIVILSQLDKTVLNHAGTSYSDFPRYCNGEEESIERHLHALMCSVSDHPPSCE